MWSGKWLVAVLLTGQNVFAQAGNAMGNRLGAVDDSGDALSLLTGVQENLRIMFNPLTILMLLGVLAVCAALWMRSGKRLNIRRLHRFCFAPRCRLCGTWCCSTIRRSMRSSRTGRCA